MEVETVGFQRPLPAIGKAEFAVAFCQNGHSFRLSLHDYFKGEQLRTVAYNNVANAMGGVLGSSYGTGNPVKRVTSVLSMRSLITTALLADIKNAAKLPLARAANPG